MYLLVHVCAHIYVCMYTHTIYNDNSDFVGHIYELNYTHTHIAHTHSHTCMLTYISVAFGMRKALQAEQGKSDMENKIVTLEAEKKDLERQIQDLKAKCEAIEKRESERRQVCICV
jgi:hypothetical protein